MYGLLIVWPNMGRGNLDGPFVKKLILTLNHFTYMQNSVFLCFICHPTLTVPAFFRTYTLFPPFQVALTLFHLA